jgi:hypothetical protein
MLLLTDFSLSVAPSLQTISAGETATYTLTVTPINGLSKAVTLTCSFVPVPPQATTCSVNPGSVTPDGMNPVTATVTVKTTSHSLAPPPPPAVGFPGSGLLLVILAVLLAMTLWVRRREIQGYALPLAFLVLLAAFAASCDTTFEPIIQGTAPGKGTPGGLYTVNVVATAGMITHNITTNLGVH